MVMCVIVCVCVLALVSSRRFFTDVCRPSCCSRQGNISLTYRNVLAATAPDWNGSCMRCSHGDQVEFFGALAHSFFQVRKPRKL